MTDDNKLDDYMCKIDETVSSDFSMEMNESFTADDLPKTSPKRGRPRKQRDEYQATPPPKPPAPSRAIAAPPKLDSGLKSQLINQMMAWKSSPVFGERLSHLDFNNSMSLAELTTIFNEMKSIIQRDFYRKVVEGFFDQSLDMTENFMVGYMEWEHARGFAEDMKNEKISFQEELEEISLLMAGRANIGPHWRLLGKVSLKGMEVLNRKLRGVSRNKTVDVEF